MIYAAIAAGGTGIRMGADKPKQFLKLGDKPILIRTIEAFYGFVDEVYIGILPEWKEYAETCIADCGLINKIKVRVVNGADNRSATLLNVIRQIEAAHGINEDDIVLTHDAVRPFINKRIISENIKLCEKYGAAGTFVSSVDTVGVSKDGKILDSILERKLMYNVQTPQTVNLALIKKLLEKEFENLERFTDICGLLRENGVDVAMVKGERVNIKITSPADMVFAESILRE
ncbi:MAG: IspD/TarI family cytidylyltransferase [Bacillota bacterium]|nr:IspD/TarI family cytidylyltransferase [Bacillota bacterium]